MPNPNENAARQHQTPRQGNSLPNPNVVASVDEKLDRTNDYLAQLLRHSEKLTDNTLTHQQAMRQQQRGWPMFLRKMAIEVPPVVLAVLLAFGINSWWQQRRAEQVAAQALDNIIAETQANLVLYKRVIRLDQRNLKRLNREIRQVRAGIIDLDTLYGAGRGYGQGVNTFVMQEGAWQAATLTSGIERFSSDLIQDASEVYSRIHFRNVDHAGFHFGGYERYQEETLLASLLENQDILLDHISNCSYDTKIIRSFLEKYDPTFEP